MYTNKLQITSHAVRDLVSVLVIGIMVYLGAHTLDLFRFITAHGLDEIFVVVPTFVIGLIWFAYRRSLEAREIDSHYRMLVDRSWALIGMHDLDGVVQSVNPAITECLNYPAEELQGMSLGDFCVATYREKFDRYLEIIKQKGSHRGRFYLLSKDGDQRVWEYKNAVIKPRHGNSMVVIQALDITKRQVAEGALKQSEERFKQFAEAAADWWYETDEQLRIVYLSSRFEENSGVASDRVLGHSLVDLTTYWNKELGGWKEFSENLDNRKSFRDFQFPMIKQDSGFCIVHLSGTPFTDQHGAFGGYRGSGKDVTHEHQLTQKLAYQASRDPLTKLLNRSAFEQRVKQAVTSAKSKGSRHALCYIDLDQFKIVNDTAGHSAGDELLRQLANLFRRHIKSYDALARLGGDEFAIVLMNQSLDKASELADKIMDDMRGFKFEWRGSTFTVSASIGVVEIVAASGGVEDVIRQSDVSCYMAKELGRNRVYVYRPDDTAVLRHDAAMNQATELSAALAGERFRLYCQPVMRITNKTPQPLMYEILLRLMGRDGEILLPHDFISSAERYGFMPRIDRWVVERTLQVVGPRIEFISGAGLALNISGTSLNDERFVEFLHEQLDNSNVPANQIYFELTETAAIRHPDEVSEFMTSLKKRGCRFVLDDFGSSLSSYRYLKELPIDYLKVDGEFVKRMDHDPIDEAMVAAIHRVGQLMGVETIAECVESEAALRKLRGMGFQCAQGLALEPPKPFTAIMASGSASGADSSAAVG